MICLRSNGMRIGDMSANLWKPMVPFTGVVVLRRATFIRVCQGDCCQGSIADA